MEFNSFLSISILANFFYCIVTVNKESIIRLYLNVQMMIDVRAKIFIELSKIYLFLKTSCDYFWSPPACCIHSTT